MTRPDMVIVYVSDAPTAARFYADLFDLRPTFESPGFVTFPLSGDVQLALWSRHEHDLSAARTSELCVTVPGGVEPIDRCFDDWRDRGVTVVEQPHDEVFGRTFVVADPDGNLIRVAPVD